MRKTWRELEKDHDAFVVVTNNHITDSAAKSSDLEREIRRVGADVMESTEELKKLNEMVEPIADFFRSTKLVNMGLKWVLAVAVAIIAIAGGIKQIFFK